MKLECQECLFVADIEEFRLVTMQEDEHIKHQLNEVETYKCPECGVETDDDTFGDGCPLGLCVEDVQLQRLSEDYFAIASDMEVEFSYSNEKVFEKIISAFFIPCGSCGEVFYSPLDNFDCPYCGESTKEQTLRVWRK